MSGAREAGAATEPLEPAPVACESTELIVGGMTCAACVGRVEKKLGRLDGVSASVNLATGKARVSHPAAVTPAELVAVVEGLGFTARLPQPPAPREDASEGAAPEADASDRAEASARTRLLVTALLSVPVLVLSMAPALQFRNWQWLCFALATPVAVWGAWPFHDKALRGLRHAAATMDTLVSLGVLASYSWSTYALFFGGAGEPGMRMPFTLLPSGSGMGGTADVYLEAVVAVPLFVLAGRMLEARARRGTGSALRALASLAAKDVVVRGTDGAERRVPIAELRVGDRFVVRPGERVATDGVVVAGSSALDLSLVTGESAPVEAGPGAAVVGGAVNSGGLLEVRATAVGADTQLARIARLVEDAQAGKARVQRLADAVAGVFVPAVLAVAVTVLGFWLGAGADPQAAITSAVAVLVVACPCALGLATPTALLAATGRGAGLGILVSGPQALEGLRRVDTVVLDKTGTLTTGSMAVTEVTARAGGLGAEAAVRLAAAAESGSEHPVGRAIHAYALRTPAGERAVPLPPVEEFSATTGVGVAGRVEGHRVEVVRPDSAKPGEGAAKPREGAAKPGEGAAQPSEGAAKPRKRGAAKRSARPSEAGLPAALGSAVRAAEKDGRTVVLVRVDGTAEAVIALGDTVRPGSYRAVDHLKRLGLRPVLATGDSAAAAHAVAGELGITEVHARATPEDKAELVRTLRARGHRVAVIGDGVNDTAALAGADLGIAMGSGTDAAIGAADVTLVREDMGALADAVRLARRTSVTVRANLVWAFGYNLVTVPLAVVGLLSPMVAAAAMSVSSLLVVGNSLRLRGWQPTPTRTSAGRGRGPARAGGRPGGRAGAPAQRRVGPDGAGRPTGEADDSGGGNASGGPGRAEDGGRHDTGVAHPDGASRATTADDARRTGADLPSDGSDRTDGSATATSSRGDM
ncbi:heavy metal translocating P-type ATPase [Streptomyces netropsis]|uniref:Cation-transporting P-type ATPase B n=1 Tax=Streptomyces netropsis TaxID=55404 RepID=A0A7W7LB08_STRNE|nr:heavy metal translocating P-type ATPase [Streptomyces netropsis]MBB4886361.1 Cu+-exporting ATPase [Streptomyces netropsis]GGR19617.1 carbonate dehydratase [Streptomyces netropsis]